MRMPIVMDRDVAEFRNDTIVEFHEYITEYSAAQGLKNVICLMPYQLAGIGKGTTDGMDSLLAMDISRICSIKNIDNVGTDPYWFGSKNEPYEYNYNASKKCIEVADSFGKDHNIWIQSYNAPRGREDEIIQATEAAYDAGARTILAWSFHSAESNSYRSENTERSWLCTVEGMKRIKSMDRDRILAENRKKYMK